MPEFTDIHMHCLYGVDDGAANEAQMRSIIDASYADGTRILCATPHCHSGFFGDNSEESDKAFETLRDYAETRYSDLKVFRGNELRYSGDFVNWMNSGLCRTLNGTRYVLVDFFYNESGDYIVKSIHEMLNSGYIPVLAHAERYVNFHRDMREIIDIRENGAVIQMDATSPFGGWGLGDKIRSRRILEHGLYDIVGSDAHNTTTRPPILSDCYRFVMGKYGEDLADSMFCRKGIELLGLDSQS